MQDLIQNVHKTQEYFLWALSKEIFEEKGVTAFASAIHDPNINCALQTGDIEDTIDARIDAVNTFFKRLNLSGKWVMNPLKDQTDLKAGLMHHGFSFYSRYPVMVYQFSDPTLEIVLNNFDVREISREMLFDWIVPLKEGFKSTETNALQYHDVHQRALQKKANFRHFVAYVDGKPVAAATLSLSEYGARLDDIATRPRFQRKGFARAVTLYALKVAKELGYLWVCLEASDQGIPLYTKMGFKRIYNNEVFENKNEITK